MKVAWVAQNVPEFGPVRIRILNIHNWMVKQGIDSRLLSTYGEITDEDSVVISQFGQEDVAYAKAIKSSGKQLIIDICENILEYPNVREMLTLADRVTCCSHRLAELVEAVNPHVTVLEDAHEGSAVGQNQLRRGSSLQSGDGLGSSKQAESAYPGGVARSDSTAGGGTVGVCGGSAAPQERQSHQPVLDSMHNQELPTDACPPSYSILMPWSHVEGREQAFYRAAESWVHWYGGKRSLEFCIVLSPYGGPMPVRALDLLSQHFVVKVAHGEQWTRCSSAPINQASRMSTKDWLVLTSPEIMPNCDVLSEMDQYFRIDPHQYIVASVIEVDHKDQPVIWLQHRQHNPRGLHFFSAMRRSTWDKIGGFDESYSHGISYEDNDFERRTVRAGVRMEQISRDDAHAVHLPHSRGYQTDSVGKILWEKNRALYVSKWG